MTLTERKLNPEITAVLSRTLTEPEMEQAAGGDYNRKLIILCDQPGIHDFVFTGKYQYVEHPLCGYYRSFSFPRYWTEGKGG